jgi:hypothetical protein
MTFSGWYVENVMYSFYVLDGKDIMDCTIIKRDNSWLYECINCSSCYQLKHCYLCKTCINSQFLYDCRGCSDCFMCSELRNKKYHFKNKEYSKEEYEKILVEYKLNTFSGMEKARKEFEIFLANKPKKCVQTFQNVNCLGDNIANSKNVKYSFIVKGCENCRYCDFITDDKDSFDITMSGEIQECYESNIVNHSQLNLFGVFSVKSQDIKYTQHCHNCKYVIGCDALRDSKYCILNKQYTKEKYEELLPKIIKHMNEMPYIDKKGRVYKFGEFYPPELSPFGYNETQAIEQVPLTKEEAIQNGYKWQDNLQRTTGKETIKPEDIPESINEVQDSILNEILSYVECKRNYKIIQNELNFYRKMGIPIPRRCFYCRHAKRVKFRVPHLFKLWPRSCMCKKEGHFHGDKKCEVEFETTYAPERPETVICEQCYQQEVY